jgi:hypothetical protein
LQLVDIGYLRRGVRDWAEHWQRKFPPSEMDEWEERLRKDMRELGLMP